MAVYKIFASADATIYSSSPSENTGLDEILEIGCFNKNVALTVSGENTSDDLRRALIKFDYNDIGNAYSLISGSYDVNLRLYLANATDLSIPYTISVNRIDLDWVMGTGKRQDIPINKNGVCWTNTGSYSSFVDSGWAVDYYLTPGGGGWTDDGLSQSFGYKDNKDLNVSVYDIVSNWISNSGSDNFGIIAKLADSIEQNPDSSIGLSFFSVDTHTIYPPTLEFKWDDSTYNTGSLGVVSNSNTIITLANNLGDYKVGQYDGFYNFRISARDKYPQRAFVTSSVYTVNKALPATSYWAIQDVKTEEMVVDFDTNYTKISCDSIGSFFSIYTNGLEPERYYKILIKVLLDSGESLLVDNNTTFKIIR